MAKKRFQLPVRVFYERRRIIDRDVFLQIQHANQPRYSCVNIDGKFCLLHLEYLFNSLFPEYSQQMLGTIACDICNRMSWKVIVCCRTQRLFWPPVLLAISMAPLFSQIHMPTVYEPFKFMTKLLLSNTLYHRKRMTASK